MAQVVYNDRYAIKDQLNFTDYGSLGIPVQMAGLNRCHHNILWSTSKCTTKYG